jgi:hypothetical protein
LPAITALACLVQSPSANSRSAPVRRRRGRLGRPLAAWPVLMLLLVAGSAHGAVGSTRLDSSTQPQTLYLGCCTDPDVLDFGVHIDFTSMADDDTLSSQFRSSGILFGTAATPNATPTVVETDWSRVTGCRKVITGLPTYQGWVLFIFADTNQNRWAAVRDVGADVGYCDRLNSCFIAAYDAAGTMLEAKFNSRVGFQFLSIQRPTPDISLVLVGGCLSTGIECYPDPGGSAMSCLTYSPPISSVTALPDSFQVPGSPVPPPTPAVTPEAGILMGLLMAGTALWTLRRSRSRTPRDPERAG